MFICLRRRLYHASATHARAAVRWIPLRMYAFLRVLCALRTYGII